MRIMAWLHHQVADLLTDFVFTPLAAVLPQFLTNRFLWHVAGIEWLFPGTYAAIRHSETICFDSATELPRRWAWTTLMEAAQAWRLMLGLRPRLEVRGNWPDQPGFIAAGMHYGAGICALWHLRESGLQPRFVFRPVAARDLPGRPLKLAWYQLRTRLIRRLCPPGPISTGGAGNRILQVLETGRAAPVVLFDTPMRDNGDWRMRVGKAKIPLRSGGARLFGQMQTDVTFFTVTIEPDTGRLELAITRLESGVSLQDQVLQLMETAMSRDPGQWLLWHGVEGMFQPSSGQTEST